MLHRRIYSSDDVGILQEDLTKLEEWSARNKMPFNISKSEVISFTHKTTSAITATYRMNDAAVLRNKRLKYLGVVLDSRLTFADHLESVIAKMRQVQSSSFGVRPAAQAR